MRTGATFNSLSTCYVISGFCYLAQFILVQGQECLSFTILVRADRENLGRLVIWSILVVLESIVCVSSSMQFILVQTRSICAISNFSSYRRGVGFGLWFGFNELERCRLCQLDQGSLYSCIQGVFVSFTILARAGEELYVVRSFSSCGRETGFLYLGRMTVLILRMSIAFSFKLLCSVNLRHRRLWTIFSYMGMGKLFVFESKSLFLACRAV